MLSKVSLGYVRLGKVIGLVRLDLLGSGKVRLVHVRSVLIR
jgi:hypothetical protein